MFLANICSLRFFAFRCQICRHQIALSNYFFHQKTKWTLRSVNKTALKIFTSRETEISRKTVQLIVSISRIYVFLNCSLLYCGKPWEKKKPGWKILIFKKRFRLPPTHMINALAIVDSSFICDVMNFQQKMRKKSDRFEIAPICVRCWTCGRKSPCCFVFFFVGHRLADTWSKKSAWRLVWLMRRDEKWYEFGRRGGQDGERRRDRLSTEIVSGDIRTSF